MKNATFIKIMMMTTSNSDGEALTAIRRANKILADAKTSWAELLDAVQADQSYRVPPSTPTPKKMIAYSTRYSISHYRKDLNLS